MLADSSMDDFSEDFRTDGRVSDQPAEIWAAIRGKMGLSPRFPRFGVRSLQFPNIVRPFQSVPSFSEQKADLPAKKVPDLTEKL
jgi:hypothetical protein